MSHHVESMCYVGETPWHKFGTSCTGFLTTGECQIASGVTWEVTKEPMFLADGPLVPGQYAIRRTSDGAILGHTGNRYQELQPSKVFSWYDPAVQSGEVVLETAGSFACVAGGPGLRSNGSLIPTLPGA